MTDSIDMTPFTAKDGSVVRNLTGQDRGLKIRDELSIDALDLEDGPIDVLFPDYLIGVTVSFFQGAFARSVRNLGGAEAFDRHYRIRGSETVKHQIKLALEILETRRDQAI